MRHLTLAVLASSLLVNVYLITRIPSLRWQAPPGHVVPSGARHDDLGALSNDAATEPGFDARQLRQAGSDLTGGDRTPEAETTSTAKRSDLEIPDVSDLVILDPRDDLRVTLRRVQQLDAVPRRLAYRWLGKHLRMRPDRVAEVFEILRVESDPLLLNALTEVIRAGVLRAVLPRQYGILFELLRNSRTCEQRVAAAWALAPCAMDDATKVAWAARLCAAIRAEVEPRILAVLARMLYDYAEELPDVVQAMREVVESLPPGSDRRVVLALLGRARVATQGVRELRALRARVTSPEMSADIAWAIAHCTHLPDEPSLDVSLDQRAIQREAARMRFLWQYERVVDPKSRELLLVQAQWHRGLLEIWSDPPDAASFLRTLAAREPDEALRSRIEMLAAAVLAGQVESGDHADRILCGE